MPPGSTMTDRLSNIAASTQNNDKAQSLSSALQAPSHSIIITLQTSLKAPHNIVLTHNTTSLSLSTVDSPTQWQTIKAFH